MSNARLSPVTRFPHAVHPSILRAARAMHEQDWRVTSILRSPSPNHSRGVAMDTAPMTATQGGIGLRTAWVVWALLTNRAPPDSSLSWAVIAELDHVHVQLATEPAIGANVEGRTYLYRPDPRSPPPPGLTSKQLISLPFSIIC